MEPYEYKTLFEFEISYWWYKGLRDILINSIKGLGLGPSARILDAGCGTGGNLKAIQEKITPHSFGFDFSPHASPFWLRYNLNHACIASINEIPFHNDAFHAAICVDVFECEEVLEAHAYRELWRVVRPGGFIVLVVPAHPWLFRGRHDIAIHARRRYTKRRLRELLQNAPVRIIRMTHLFPTTFPLIASYRFFQRLTRSGSRKAPRSDLRSLPAFLNKILCRITDTESLLLRKINFHFGSPILAIVKK